MLEVVKNGKTDYGFWAYGTLKYNGLTITDIFPVNVEKLENGKAYPVKNVDIRRSKKTGKFVLKLTL